MKKIYQPLLILLAICQFAKAQAPAIQWQKCLGGKNYDYGSAVKQTSDNGFIIAATTNSTDGDVKSIYGGSDSWVIKLDKKNNIEWQITIGGSYDEYSNSILQTSDGGYLLAATTYSFDYDIPFQHGGSDILIVKLNAKGKTEWIKTYGGSFNDEAGSVIETKKGDFMMIGTTNSNNGDVYGLHGFSDDVWLLNIDKNGFINWQQCAGGTGNERGISIQQTKDKGFIFSARTDSNDGDVYGNHGASDIWLVKTDAAYVVEWQKCMGGSVNDYPGNVVIHSDGGYLVSGVTESFNGDVTNNYGSFDAWLVKCKNNGVIEWQQSFGGTNVEGVYSLPGTVTAYQTIDGGYFFATTTNSKNKDITHNNGRGDFWLVKLDSKRKITWQKSLGGSKYEDAYNAIVTRDGGYAIIGSTESDDKDVKGQHSKKTKDIWLVKMAPDVMATAKQASLPQIKITPNPAQHFIQFNAPQNGIVTISSATGTVMFARKIAAGAAQINISAFTAGEYHIQLACDSMIYGQKFIKQ